MSGRHRPSRVDGPSLALLVSPTGTWRAAPAPKHRLPVSGRSIAAFAHPLEATHRLLHAVRRTP